MNKYFDTHCHFNPKFNSSDFESQIKEANSNNVCKIVLPGTTIEDSLFGVNLSQKFKNVFAAIGIHPTEVVSIEDVKFLDSVDIGKVIAIGETGLDLHYEDNPSLELQEKVFIEHINFALKHNLPLIIHSRDAAEQTYNILSNYPNVKFVMHSFSYSLDWAIKFIQLGGYISFTGVITFKNARELQNVASSIPLECILCETDSPFLSPHPFRGLPNHPKNVKIIVDFLASLREEEDDIVIKSIYQNSLNFFGLKE